MTKIMTGLACAIVLLSVAACMGEKPAMSDSMSSDIPHGCSPATTPCP